MKKLLVMCLVLTCLCIAASVLAENGTLANAPKNLTTPALTGLPHSDDPVMQHSLDMEYILQQKKLGTLKADDPVYLRVLEAARQSAPTDRGNNLDQGNDNCPATIIAALPYTDDGTTSGYANDFTCAGNSAGDVVYQYTATVAELLTVQTCGGITNYDSRLEVRTGACPGAANFCNDDYCGLQSRIDVNVNVGDVITIVVDGYSNNSGNYTLSVSAAPPPPPVGRCCYQGACYDGIDIAYCASIGGVPGSAGSTCASEPCPPPPPPPGALRVITVPVPSSLGVSIGADCRGDLYYTNYSDPTLYQMDAFGTLIVSNPILDASGNSHVINEIGWDEGRQLFWGGEQGTNAIYTLDRTGLATYQFAGMGGYTLTDGLDYDGTDGTIWHSTDVSANIAHFDATGLLLGTLTLYDENGNPEGTISGVEMGANNTIFAGNSPIDDVRRCDKTTGAFVSRFDAGQVRCEGMECDAINFAPQTVLWVKDAYNNTVTAFEIDAGTCVCAQLPDTCLFPYQEIDDGDLAACNYPTFHANPGHGLSGIAWLGAGITGEPAPNSLNLDPADDGVVFAGLPWTPCTPVTVTVTVTGGPVYPLFENCGGRLYLNAWKDGNLDGDFCDELCGPAPLPVASEWLIHDVLVVPGIAAYTFIDPGVFDLGVYDGVFRFRLTSTPVGRHGFGLMVAGACVWNCPATFGLDYLGEVEDYIIPEAQLAVDLSSFTATGSATSIALNWTTASESNNDHFEVLRNGTLVHTRVSSGNTSSGSTYEWVDGSVEMGRTYTYALVAVDGNGQREELGTVEASPNANAVVVTEYSLHQNFPNPFNPSTTITFDLVESGNVTLQVFNLMGQEVATLVNGNLSSGRHTLNFSAAGLPSGLYLYKLEANGFSAQKKMLLMK